MSACMISFRGHEAPGWVLDGLERGSVGAVCLFAYNVASLGQLRALNLSLMEAAAAGGHPPPIIGIDQEGGQLMAVGHGATELPGNMALGAAGSAALARRTGEVLGEELRALGCNMNFAPVLDLATQAANDVIGVRSFGADPAVAGSLGIALVEGLQSRGVLATAKHFPGHGDTPLDSHHATPVIGASRTLLEERELVPFRAAIGAGVAAVMSCHAVYPALDDVIATYSRRVLKDLLRDELGFDGLVLTDALDMRAAGDLPALERARRALRAGADLAMLGHLPGQAEVVAALAGETDPESAARVMAVRCGLPTELPPLSVVGCAAHALVARETAEAAVTAVRGTPRLRAGVRLLVITVVAGDLTPAETATAGVPLLAEQLRRRVPGTAALQLRHGAAGAELDALIGAVERWRAGGDGEVVVATVNAVSDPVQLELLRRLEALGLDPFLVATRSPLDAVAASSVKRAVAAYGRRAPQMEAVARALVGEVEARGRLPLRVLEGAPGAGGEGPAA